VHEFVAREISLLPCQNLMPESTASTAIANDSDDPTASKGHVKCQTFSTEKICLNQILDFRFWNFKTQQTVEKGIFMLRQAQHERKLLNDSNT
jgi:hypothetical protein